MLKITAAALTLAVLLSGCVSTSGQVTIRVDDSRLRPYVKIPHPGPVKLARIRWVVVTKDNVEEVTRKTGSAVLFALTPDGVRKLQQNDLKLLELVRKNRRVILAYEAYLKK